MSKTTTLTFTLADGSTKEHIVGRRGKRPAWLTELIASDPTVLEHIREAQKSLRQKPAKVEAVAAQAQA